MAHGASACVTVGGSLLMIFLRTLGKLRRPTIPLNALTVTATTSRVMYAGPHGPNNVATPCRTDGLNTTASDCASWTGPNVLASLRARSTIDWRRACL